MLGLSGTHTQTMRSRVLLQARAMLRAWRNPPAFPSMLQIEPTNRCNLKCVMCPHGFGPPAHLSNMSLDMFKRILDEFPLLNSVHIQGLGEPLLHPKLIDMIEYAKQRGLATAFITNLTVLNDRMAERLVRAGHDLVFVSIDSMDPAIVASLRRGASYDVLGRVLENVDRIRTVRTRLGSDKPEIEVFSIIMQHALPGLRDFVGAIKAAGIRKVCFQDLVPEGIDPEERLSNGARLVDEPISALPREEQRTALEQIRGLNDDEIEVVPPHFLEMLDSPVDYFGGIPTCLDLWERPMVAVDGTVAACCYALGIPHLHMGNIYEQSFREIWFGVRYQKLRLQHLTNRRVGPCKDCVQLYQVLEPASVERERMRQSGLQAYTNTFLGRRRYSFGRPVLREAWGFAVRRTRRFLQRSA